MENEEKCKTGYLYSRIRPVKENTSKCHLDPIVYRDAPIRGASPETTNSEVKSILRDIFSSDICTNVIEPGHIPQISNITTENIVDVPSTTNFDFDKALLILEEYAKYNYKFKTEDDKTASQLTFNEEELEVESVKFVSKSEKFEGEIPQYEELAIVKSRPYSKVSVVQGRDLYPAKVEMQAKKEYAIDECSDDSHYHINIQCGPEANKKNGEILVNKECKGPMHFKIIMQPDSDISGDVESQKGCACGYCTKKCVDNCTSSCRLSVSDKSVAMGACCKEHSTQSDPPPKNVSTYKTECKDNCTDPISPTGQIAKDQGVEVRASKNVMSETPSEEVCKYNPKNNDPLIINHESRNPNYQNLKGCSKNCTCAQQSDITCVNLPSTYVERALNRGLYSKGCVPKKDHTTMLKMIKSVMNTVSLKNVPSSSPTKNTASQYSKPNLKKVETKTIASGNKGGGIPKHGASKVVTCKATKDAQTNCDNVKVVYEPPQEMVINGQVYKPVGKRETQTCILPFMGKDKNRKEVDQLYSRSDQANRKIINKWFTQEPKKRSSSAVYNVASKGHIFFKEDQTNTEGYLHRKRKRRDLSMSYSDLNLSDMFLQTKQTSGGHIRLVVTNKRSSDSITKLFEAPNHVVIEKTSKSKKHSGCSCQEKRSNPGVVQSIFRRGTGAIKNLFSKGSTSRSQ